MLELKNHNKFIDIRPDIKQICNEYYYILNDRCLSFPEIFKILNERHPSIALDDIFIESEFVKDNDGLDYNEIYIWFKTFDYV